MSSGVLKLSWLSRSFYPSFVFNSTRRAQLVSYFANYNGPINFKTTIDFCEVRYSNNRFLLGGICECADFLLSETVALAHIKWFCYWIFKYFVPSGSWPMFWSFLVKCWLKMWDRGPPHGLFTNRLFRQKIWRTEQIVHKMHHLLKYFTRFDSYNTVLSIFISKRTDI